MPVWVAAAAKAAAELLNGEPFSSNQSLHLPDQEDSIIVPVSSGAITDGGTKALAISFCDSGLGLDITRGMEIWTYVSWGEAPLNNPGEDQESFAWLHLDPGFGVGIHKNTGEICLSEFAQKLLQINLRQLVPYQKTLKIEIIFPQGYDLAIRTSNVAFGVVDGLALIGTQAESKVSASPDQLNDVINELKNKCLSRNFTGQIIFVIGENGFDIAIKLGLDPCFLIKVGNWLGPLIVAAAENKVSQLLIIGYHGKMVKLAGGIFHTHHHLADGRLETLIAIAFKNDIPPDLIRLIVKSDSVESAWINSASLDAELAQKLWLKVASDVESRSLDYLAKYVKSPMSIGAALFDRSRCLRWMGPAGLKQLDQLMKNFEAK